MKDKEKTNFLEETLACLRQHGKTEEEVLWVGRGFGGRQDRPRASSVRLERGSAGPIQQLEICIHRGLQRQKRSA